MSSTYIDSQVESPIGQVPRVKTVLDYSDKAGGWKARWGMGRMSYIIEPGLYAVGSPGAKSPVMVSANYKLSFDVLRSSLPGLDAWVLVIDTKGINVWCAAGKGTFGTAEIVNRIALTKLHQVVEHRKIIIPQLGAPGVSAHEVKANSGFQVMYGPVRACYIKAFLEAGMKANKDMRRVKFPLADRLKLVGIEVTGSFKYFAWAAVGLLVLSGISKQFYSIKAVFTQGILAVIILSAAYLSGTAAGPALLPWLPGRAFSLKGFWAGLAAAIGVLFILRGRLSGLEISGWLFIMPAVASFLLMNFTGASTYTSLSGVKKEMRIAVPLQSGFAIVGLTLWVAGRFA